MGWSSRLSWIAVFFSVVNATVFSQRVVSVNRGPDDRPVRFDGHRLYRVRPTGSDERRILREIWDDEGYSVWNSLYLDERVDVMVSPEKFESFEKLVEEKNLDVSELMNDVQSFIDQENPLSNLRDVFGWKAYHELDQIYRWLDTLAGEYPNLITPLVGGSSYEGRNITGVKLSFGEGNPGVFLEGGIHAREWISPAVVTFILNELITSKNPDVRAIAESHDWYVFPVFNPDGYVYTHKVNRLWRKTRQPYSFGCVGADPNRNWDFHWKETGASSSPCSESFAGSAAFSEIETRTMSEFATTLREKIFAYIAFHSYSQVLLFPYGFTNDHVENYQDLVDIGNATVEALKRRHNTRYRVGSVVEIMYPASGNSMDWVRGALKIPVTFTYELRDRGRFGFILPADQIVPTGEETLDSLVALLQTSRRIGYGSEVV
ncbi:zinc carboxypeptidase-like [Athalia rosae]|uniref:zinc carboxypeptidase-like n=1 Tax=Athalia rosae TaxID=37344 RepID=UPI0020340214|nr:zinc carboxypeptidase-like [Athalia rosae]